MKIKDIVIEQNKSSDTTVVFVQGGLSKTPLADPSLIMADLTKHSYYYAKSIRFLKEYVCEYVNFAQVKQVHHIREVKVQSLKHAFELQKENIDLIHEAIVYYKSLNHKVILFGHSSGGVIVNEYIREKGLDKLEKVIIANTRFQYPKFVPENIEKKQVFIRFDHKGNRGVEEKYRDNKKLKLLYSCLLYNDYTKELNDVEMSKVTLICADGDSLTGNLNDQETNFIQNSGCNLIRFPLWKSRLYRLMIGNKITLGSMAHHMIFTPSCVFKLKKLVTKGSTKLKFRHKMKENKWNKYRIIRKIFPINKLISKYPKGNNPSISVNSKDVEKNLNLNSSDLKEVSNKKKIEK